VPSARTGISSGVPITNGVPSGLNNGGGSGAGSPGLKSGGNTNGGLTSDPSGLSAGNPAGAFGYSALTGVNPLINSASEASPVNNTLFIGNILNYLVLISNTVQVKTHPLRLLLRCKKPGPCT
jgi:hypothetical protein